jgi:hypothetical protein
MSKITNQSIHNQPEMEPLKGFTAGRLDEAEVCGRLRRMLGGPDSDLKKLTEDQLPVEMLSLRGVKQSEAHGGLDPLQHTLRMLAELDTNGLRYPELVKAASVLHDIGKVAGASAEADWTEHPGRGAHMVEPILLRMGYEEWERAMIKHLIGTHNILGRLAQRDDWTDEPLISVSTAKEELKPPKAFQDRVTTPEMLEMHYRIISADMRSIPGLAGHLPEIQKQYETMKRVLSYQ